MYKNPFDSIRNDDGTIKSFGACVRTRREQLGITLRKMAKDIGMSAVYLSDIERENRPAPNGSFSNIDYLTNMIRILQLNQKQIENFFDLAFISQLGNHIDCRDYFSTHPEALNVLLRGIKENWSNDDWKKLLVKN